MKTLQSVCLAALSTALLTLVSFVGNSVDAFAQTPKKILVLPFEVYNVDAVSARTLVSLLQRELESGGRYTVIDAGSATACDGIDCAVEAGKAAGADRVVYGDFSRLGTKILWAFTLVDVWPNKKIFSGDVTEFRIEEMQAEVPWVARSLEAGMLEPRTTVTTSSGSDIVPTRILNRNYDTVAFRVGLGQLYAVSGYYDHPDSFNPDTLKRAFVFDVYTSLLKENYSLNLLTAFRNGLVINIGGSYFPIKGNFSPYLGGGLGYSIYFDEETLEHDDFYISGFQAILGGGFWFMRRGSLGAYVNLDYMFTFNSRDDQAVTLTLGVSTTTDALDL